MPIKHIKKVNNIVKEVYVEKLLPPTPPVEKLISTIYPFVSNKIINIKEYYSKVGTISVPIDQNKTINGNLYIQASIPYYNEVDYSPMLISVQVNLFGNSGGTTKIFSNIIEFNKNWNSNDFYKMPINILSDIVGTNNKLGLIITAKNSGPGTGSQNIIDIIYYEKIS